MSRKLGIKLGGLVLVAAMGTAFLAPAAQATPITFYNDVSTLDPTGGRFTLGCGSASGSCTGLLEATFSISPVSWSTTDGLLLAGPSNASPASEASYVNGVLGTSLTASAGGNISPNNGNSYSFTTDADYFMIKVGNGPTDQAYALFHNLDTSLTLFFTKTGQAGGLSHYVEFDGGNTLPVPEPSELGMLGLGLLVLGTIIVVRRRQYRG